LLPGPRRIAGAVDRVEPHPIEAVFGEYRN
jgi:hypothetical protein